MTTYYFDTSALIKYYVAEMGSSWVNTIISSPDSLLFTSRLTIIEVRSVLARRRRDASITPRNHADALAAFSEDCLTRYRFIELDPILVDLAGELLERRSLRAYDAAQLASALRLNHVLAAANLARPIFVAADDRLLAVAQIEGLSTDNPNQHP